MTNIAQIPPFQKKFPVFSLLNREIRLNRTRVLTLYDEAYVIGRHIDTLVLRRSVGGRPGP